MYVRLKKTAIMYRLRESINVGRPEKKWSVAVKILKNWSTFGTSNVSFDRSDEQRLLI
jgi:hypothetical protein